MENPGLAQLLTVPTSWDKTRAPHLPPIASQLSAPLKEAASQRGKVPPKKSPPRGETTRLSKKKRSTQGKAPPPWGGAPAEHYKKRAAQQAE